MKRLLLIFTFILILCSAAWAEEGYVRLAIKGTNVNLRPQPRAGGGIVARANTSDVFIAEKYPIVLDDDKTEWYKLVLAVDSGSNKISVLSERNSRFWANVAFVRADFADVSPLEKGDMEKILGTPVGIGFGFDVNPHSGEFSLITKDNFRFFAYWCYVRGDVPIYDRNPVNDEDAKVIGRYKSEGMIDQVRLLGRDADESLYVLMDPTFKQLPGFVDANMVQKENYSVEQGLDHNAFNAFCLRYIGANIGEIARKWGDFKVERKAVDILGEGDYNIFSSLNTQDIQLRVYEQTPGLNAEEGMTPHNAISFIQNLYFARQGAGVGGIYIGVEWCGKEWVKNLLGEPVVMDEDAVGEYWAWYSEFSDVYVRFENGMVLSVAIDTRTAN